MAEIRITVAGEDQFFRRFERLDAQFEDLWPIWPDVRDEFWAIEKEQFDSEGGAGRQGKWQALSPNYAARKIEQYGDKPILQATGELLESLTGGAGHIYRPSKKDLAIGTSVKRGLYHQLGSARLPKRPPIDFNDATQTRLMKVIQKSLVRELRRGVGYIEARDRI